MEGKASESVMDGHMDFKRCNIDSDGQLERREQQLDGVWIERK